MTGDTFCNRCGHRNPKVRLSCALCDAPLAQVVGEQTAVHLAVAARQAGRSSSANAGATHYRTDAPCLLITRGSLAGSRFILRGKTVTIGRDPGSDVFLDDITVSRRQAILHHRSAGFTVVDASSFNGTYLNGVRIDGEERLAHGDELQVGKFRLIFLEP